MKNNQKGRSMIEMLGVLSIVGVLSVSGIVLYTQAMQKSKINTTISQISELISNIKSVKALRRDFRMDKCFGIKRDDPSCDDEDKDKRKIIPDSMLKTGKLVSALGSRVDIYSPGDVSGGFQIRLYYPDAQSCKKLITIDWGEGTKVSLNGPNSQPKRVWMKSEVSEYCNNSQKYFMIDF